MTTRRSSALALLVALLPALPSPALGQADADPITIVDVTVVDVEEGRLLPGRTVLVRDGTILDVGPSGAVTVPEDARTIDGRGRYLIPGLWDMHVHLTDATAAASPVLVAWGITGVRDAGGDLDAIDALREAIHAEEIVGPRIVRPGPYVDGHKPDAPHRLVVADADDARAAVAYIHARGADYLKIHNAIPREAFFALAAESRALGLPFAGHVPTTVQPLEAARAGQASLEHAVTLFEGTFMASLPRAPAEMFEGIEAFLDSGADTLAARLAALGTRVTPTLTATVLRGRRVELADDPLPCVATVAPSLRAQWDRFFPVGERDRSPGVEELRARFARLMVRFTGILHAAGVPLLAGSDLAARDVCPGVSLHDELALLVEAGLPPIEALRAATIGPARFLDAADTLGSVSTGKRADLVLLDADPLADIANTRRIVSVIAEGRPLDREDLDALLAEAEDVDPLP